MYLFICTLFSRLHKDNATQFQDLRFSKPSDVMIKMLISISKRTVQKSCLGLC